jgi:hypothetical protein
MVFVAGLHRRNPLWIACSLGLVAAWFIVATNDAWGSSQEPYQLWVDGFALASFIIVPVSLSVATSYLLPLPGRSPHSTLRWRFGIALLCLASLGVVGASSVDWLRFYKSQEGATVSFATPEDRALQSVTGKVTNDQLVMADPCISSLTLKIVTGARTAWYNPGIAWPANFSQLKAVGKGLITRHVSPSQLAAAHIGWLVTSASCSVDWQTQLSPMLIRQATVHYGASALDVVTLWRFKTTGAVVVLQQPYLYGTGSIG